MERIEVVGNVLYVRCDLNPYISREFEAKCEELLASEGESLIVDLTGAKEISSVFLSSLVHTCVEAGGAGRQVTLKIAARMQPFFDFADADPHFKIEVV